MEVNKILNGDCLELMKDIPEKSIDMILKRVGDFNKNFEPKTLFGNEM